MTINETALPTAVRSHVGRVRDGNEDACLHEGSVWLVADGLGGHAGGEVASEVAVAAAHEAIRDGIGRRDAGDVLSSAFSVAHDALRARAAQDRGLAAMGTTLVGAFVAGDTVWVGSLGDSRAYLFDDGVLRQLTTDDNYAADLVEAGVISEEEARHHPGQFMLTRALIADDPRTERPEVLSIGPSGRLLLCSDGLNAEVDDLRIAELLPRGSVDEAADALVEAALAAGGSDNITVICVDLAG